MIICQRAASGLLPSGRAQDTIEHRAFALHSVIGEGVSVGDEPWGGIARLLNYIRRCMDFSCFACERFPTGSLQLCPSY